VKIQPIGFTLIELMITVAVISILAAIAYPSYQEQMRKTRRSDATIALQQIAQAQERYYTLNGGYANTTAKYDDLTGLNDLTWDGTANGYYTSGGASKGLYVVTLASGATVSAITLEATPVSGRSQAADASCTKATLSNLGVKSGLPANNKCWNN
jgi:type IV pilus assembly protein PilE